MAILWPVQRFVRQKAYGRRTRDNKVDKFTPLRAKESVGAEDDEHEDERARK